MPVVSDMTLTVTLFSLVKSKNYDCNERYINYDAVGILFLT